MLTSPELSNIEMKLCQGNSNQKEDSSELESKDEPTIEKILKNSIRTSAKSSLRISISVEHQNQGLFREICAVADEIQSGKHAKDFNDILNKVFKHFE